MRNQLRNAIGAALAAGASYADARWVRRKRQGVKVRTGRVDYLDQFEEEGVGIRALANGAWGFACASETSGAALAQAAGQAVELARAAAETLSRPATLDSRPAVRAVYRTPVAVDPFQISLEKKIAFLYGLDGILRSDRRVTASVASCECFETHKIYLDSEGADVEQILIETGAGVQATASDGDEVQTRSAPCSFGGDYATGGWEFVEGLDLERAAQRAVREAVDLLSAPQCPAGVTDLVLDGQQMALQIHESIGHPLELDRIFGSEASYAGTSFVKPDDAGRLTYGSPLLNVTADALAPGGLGSFGFDDEGVPASAAPLIRDGVLRGFLTSRETAARIGAASSGCMRAESWNRFPLVRMTNVNLHPGFGNVEELIAGVREGVYMETNRSWSIDDRRVNFQFGCELAREIRDGRIGRLLKNPTYTGRTLEFWKSLDAVAGPKAWRIWGIPDCGKGQPGQTAHVGHGASPARFRNVQVGVV